MSTVLFYAILGALLMVFCVFGRDADRSYFYQPCPIPPTIPPLEVLRQDYVRQQMGRDLEEIEQTIAEIEQALRWPHNSLDAQLQRANLDCLNTAYVLKLMQQNDERFWALHKQ